MYSTIERPRNVEKLTAGSLVQVEKAKANGVGEAYVWDLQEPISELGENVAFTSGSWDKIFSNATLHWCKRDPKGVLCISEETVGRPNEAGRVRS